MKRQIPLFLRVESRAIHLEFTRDTTVVEFRVTLQRFASRRGIPSTIISDNAKTFKSTGTHLKKLCKDEEVQGYLAGRQML